MDLPAEIVEIRDGKPMVSSLQVAEKFGKRHSDVLRSIQNVEMSEEFRRRNFALAEYADAQGKPRPLCWLTRDGFWALAMTFTGKEAAKLREGIISALNKAEETIKQGCQRIEDMDEEMLLHKIADRFGQLKSAATNERQQRLLESEERRKERENLIEDRFAAQEREAALRRAFKRNLDMGYRLLKEHEEMGPPPKDMFAVEEAKKVPLTLIKKEDK